MSEDQHVYHHNEPVEMRLNVVVEKNTKGYNYSVTVVNASCTEEALEVIDDTINSLAAQYGAEEMTAKIAKLEDALAEAIARREVEGIELAPDAGGPIIVAGK